MSGRGEQIVARLFVKVALLISDARLTNRDPASLGAAAKTDKWFQLEVRDDGRFGSLAQEMREQSNNTPLELSVRTVLVLPHLAPPSTQALVLLPEPSATSATSRRARVNLTADTRAILLEEWSLSLNRTSQHPQQGEDPYPGIYKQAIALLRSLYALLRYLPTWHLHRKLGSGAPMQIVVGATLTSDVLDEDVAGFDHRMVPDDPGPSTFAFPPIATPLGAITLRCRYRPHARFRLDSLDNLWSSALASGPNSPGPSADLGQQRRGPSDSTSPASPSPPTTSAPIDLDTPAFTPTLIATRQRASLTGSGSPLRPASRTGPGPSPGTTTPSFGAGLPPIRPRTVSQLSSAAEPGPSSPRRTLYDLLPRSPPASPRLGMGDQMGEGASGLTRTRRESLLTGARSGASSPFGATGGTGLVLGMGGGGGAGGDGPPPSPSPRRTPSGINAFKSATLASSPRTIGMGMGTSPLGMGGSPRTTPGLGIGSSPRTGSALGGGIGSDGRRSLDSGGGEGGTSLGVQPQPIKRYEGSFGHRAARSQGSLGSGGVGSAGTGGGVAAGAGSAGTGGAIGKGEVGSAGVGSTGAGSTGSGGAGAGTGQAHTRLTTIGSQSYISHLADDDDIGRFLDEIDSRPQLGLDGAEVVGMPTGNARRPSGSTLSRPPLSALDAQPQRFPASSPIQERFPPSSLPTRYSALPPLSPLGRTDSPQPLPRPLDSVPPSPAEAAWPLRSRAPSQDRGASREQGIRGLSRERGMRGPSRERFGETVPPPLPERELGERVRTMSLADRDGTVPFSGRDRTLSLAQAPERERTISFARRNRTMLTTRDDVEAAVQLMTASFHASYAPPSPSTPGGRELPLGESSGGGRRQIGSEEIVGRLELGGSGSVGTFGPGGRVGGSVREGRDTDTWRETGEWDRRMGGWR